MRSTATVLRDRRELALAIVGLAAGAALAWMDTRPRFDDTGVLVVLLVVGAAILAGISGRHPWLWAVLVGLPVPIAELASGGSLASFAALGFAAIGAVAGWALARGLGGARET